MACGRKYSEATEEMMYRNPKITVVTVVLNAREFIEETIRSVLDQDYPNLEYVVVDGVSIDGTLELIYPYKHRIDRLIVEEDNGIYDAMNKAAEVALGEYIIFMNAGDQFACGSSVSKLCRYLVDDEALVYGGWIVKYPWGFERAAFPARPSDFWKGMFVQHQSIMVKTSYLRDHPFDLQIGLGADYAFLLQLVNSNVAIRECKEIISRVAAGGASDSNRIDVLVAHWHQARQFHPGLRTDFHYTKRLAREYFAALVKMCLPVALVRSVTASRS